LLGWLGLHIAPQPYPYVSQQTPVLDTVPLPDDLPVPAERFYHNVYGKNVPEIKSMVMTGRATLRLNGIIFPARFRFVHNAGHDYHHYIEACWFGLPIMKVNEYFIAGKSRLELPFGVSQGYKVDQGANLALWAESAFWLPGILLTDARVHWEPIDAASAFLVVPFGDTVERFIVRFSENGMLQFMETMRYKDKDKVLWLNEVQEWGIIQNATIPTVSALTWLDEGTPWAVWSVEDVVYNVDVSQYFAVDNF
jgi:hypothetical protein